MSYDDKNKIDEYFLKYLHLNGYNIENLKADIHSLFEKEFLERKSAYTLTPEEQRRALAQKLASELGEDFEAGADGITASNGVYQVTFYQNPPYFEAIVCPGIAEFTTPTCVFSDPKEALEQVKRIMREYLDNLYYNVFQLRKPMTKKILLEEQIQRLKSDNKEVETWYDRFWHIADILEMPGSPSVEDIYNKVIELQNKRDN